MTGDTEQGQEPWIERLPLAAERPWLSVAATLAIVALALGLRILLLPVLPTGSPFITFFPAVLLVAFLFGAQLGAVAALVSTVLALLFFMRNPLAPGYFVTAVPSSLAFGTLVAFNLALFHWMQRINAKLRAERARSAALATTRALLFRELQHRVSNNLGVAAGLLALQKRQVVDGAARDALDAASQRLAVIGRISRQLYDPDGGARHMGEFLKPLCDDVVRTSGRDGIRIEVGVEDALMLEPDAAVPLALIVAETVANAIEHGFAVRDAGLVEVSMRRDAAGAVTVEVADDGDGLPEGFDLAASNSLGLSIVRALAEQLGGRFELARGDRTSARLLLPASAHPAV
jgi:two-component sensor histidine kinase